MSVSVCVTGHLPQVLSEFILFVLVGLEGGERRVVHVNPVTFPSTVSCERWIHDDQVEMPVGNALY